MLTSISPLGERARGNRWPVTAAVYTSASVAAAAAAGAALGGVGSLFAASGAWRAGGPWRAGAFALLALAAVAADLRWLPLPTIRRQVNEDWLNRYRRWVYAGGFGAQLGLGVVTIVTTATVYLALAAELLTASPLAGAAVGATFGLVRAVPLLAAGGARSHADLVAHHRQVMALAPAGTRIAVLAAAAAGAFMAATALFASSGRL